MGVLVSTLGAALLFDTSGSSIPSDYVTALSLVAIVGAMSDLGLHPRSACAEMATRTGSERWRLREICSGTMTLTIVGCTVVTAIAWLAYSPMLAAGVALASLGLLLQATQDNFALPLVVGLRLGWVTALELGRRAACHDRGDGAARARRVRRCSPSWGCRSRSEP